jgi:apolipoprotein N-acyltransferase
MLAGLLLAALRESGWRRCGALLGVLAMLGLCGFLNGVRWTKPAGEPFRAAVVQGNIPQEQKWLPEAQRSILQLYVDLTRQQDGARLIVWPETAIPAFYQQVEQEVVPQLETEVKRRRSDLLIGIPFYDRVTDRYFNALVALGDQRGFYFKRHLVPFGEYLPMRLLLGFMLDLLQIPLSDLAAGGDRQEALKAAGYPLAATICYEDIFGQEALAGLPEAAYLVNVTNDAWFGDSLAPHQHWQMARMRANESGRYMVRATNTGVSGIVADDGSVVVAAPLFQTTAVQGMVTPMQGATPYVQYGDRPVIGLVLAILLLLGVRGRLESRDDLRGVGRGRRELVGERSRRDVR